MEPLVGISIVRAYASRFEADVAVAKLDEAGIEAVVIGDPASQVAPHLVTHHGFAVSVADHMASDAALVLDPATGDRELVDADGEQVATTRTPRQRIIGSIVLASIIGLPVVLAIIAGVESAMDALGL